MLIALKRMIRFIIYELLKMIIQLKVPLSGVRWLLNHELRTVNEYYISEYLSDGNGCY